MNTPVLFLLFNRPETTAQVFETIRRARPARLYLAADGPRKDVPEDARSCDEARSVCAAIDWDCEVKRRYLDENLGCGKAVSGAISWFFEHEEEGIILEDDCLPAQVFFHYCEELLERYRHDPRIMMIAGANYFSGAVKGQPGYFFSRHYSIWGWATWSRAWERYDFSMKTVAHTASREYLRKTFHHEAMARYMEYFLKPERALRINTWDTQWYCTCLADRGLCATPTRNLVSNIGARGAHTIKDSPFLNLPVEPFDLSELRPPEAVAWNEELDHLQYKLILKTVLTLRHRLRDYLSRLHLLPLARFIKHRLFPKWT